MNMFGVGNLMMRYVMKKKNVDDLPSLINQAVEQGVKLIACTAWMLWALQKKNYAMM